MEGQSNAETMKEARLEYKVTITVLRAIDDRHQQQQRMEFNVEYYVIILC